MIAREEFRLLPGFEDKVKVSNLGYAVNLNYRNTGKERRFELNKNNKGYLCFGFKYKGKYYNFTIHRLTAKLFIPNPDNLPEVNHKDENKLNNHVDNLEWCTSGYNSNYGTRTKRSAVGHFKRVACYKNGKLVKIYPSVSSTKEDGFNPSIVSRVCLGTLCTHRYHTFKFLE